MKHMEPTHRKMVEADQYQTVRGVFAIRPRADYVAEVFEVPEVELRSSLPAGEYVSIGGSCGFLQEPDARLVVETTGVRMELRRPGGEWEPAELAAGSGRNYPFTRQG